MSAELNSWDAMIAAMEEDGKQENNYWKFGGNDEGEVQMRLLPPNIKTEEKLPYFRVAVHYLNSKTYLCPNQTLLTSSGDIHNAESCPVCAMKEKLYKKGVKDSEEWKIAGKLKAKDRFFYRAVLIGDDFDIKEVKFVLLPKTVHDELLEKFKSKRYGIIFDFNNGRDIVLTKKGKGLTSKYSWDLLDQSKLSTDTETLKAIVSGINSKKYNELVSFSSVDEIRGAMNEYLEGGVENSFTSSNDKSEEQVFADLKPSPKPQSVKAAPTKQEVKNEDIDIDSLFNDLES